MNLRFAEAALGDLKSLKAHIATNDAALADHVLARILAIAKLLTEYPHLGHDGHVPGTFEMVVTRLPFVLIYRIDYSDDGNDLIILRCYHTARAR